MKMTELRYKSIRVRKLIFITAAVIFLSGIWNVAKAQEDPPRPPSITLTRNLSFGAFYTTTGGTVTVDQYDTRTSFNVTLFTFSSISAARFNIYANRGTIINILNIPDFQLTNGSYSMTVSITATNPLLPFVNDNTYVVPTVLTMGATLTVGAPVSNPPGNYSGTFDVTLVIE